jgi:hypothetical protein
MTRPRTDQMGPAKAGRLEEPDQCSEEVHLPQLGHARLAERQDSPDDFQSWQEVRRAAKVSPLLSAHQLERHGDVQSGTRL